MPSEIIELSLAEDLGRRLVDPVDPTIFHFEAYLPFTEAVKLKRGNANVRPPKENHPFKAMMETVEDSPELFHLKNRGITYICERFQYDNKLKRLTVNVPIIPRSRQDDDDAARFGIADGGHTFRVVEDAVENLTLLKATPGWSEPHVRVHFLAGNPDALSIEDVVEALNTSTQVKTFTLEEYRGKFEALKTALQSSGFDISQVAFRENEEKEWQVTEIIQRLACFLKDRWRITPPSSMYRAKDKALQLFLADQGGEFSKLYPVARDVITLPEFIQSSLSEYVEGRRLGNVRGVKKQRKQFRREGTDYLSWYRIDGAILLPMAAAFRSLLGLRDNVFCWKISPYDVFAKCAQDLYDVMLGRIRRVKSATQLAFDKEYWISCENVVMSAREDLK
jgi:AIPR protein